MKFWTNWTVDKLIIVSTTLCVLAEIAINFTTSYGHISILGGWYGEKGSDGHLTPIGIDFALFAFAMINLFLARKGRYVVKKNGKKRPEFRWPRWVLVIGVGGTVAANGAYGFHWGWTGAILAMGSAVLLFFTVEGGMLLLRVAAEAAEIEQERAETKRLADEAEKALQQAKNSERGKKAAITRAARRGDPGAAETDEPPVDEWAQEEAGQADPTPTVAVPALTGIGLTSGSR